MDMENVSSMLKAAYDNGELTFALNGTVNKDGSIKVTSISMSAKDPETIKTAGFKAT